MEGLDPMDFRPVRFTLLGETRYGLAVSRFDREAWAGLRPGERPIEDLVLPRIWARPEGDIQVVEFEEADAWRESQFRLAREAAASLTSFGAGKLFSVPVADGVAYYVVAAVGRDSVEVEWRGFYPDRWRDGVLGRGLEIPRARAEALVLAEELDLSQ